MPPGGGISRAVVGFLTATYGVALLRYPRRLRQEHGIEMRRLFQARLEEDLARHGLPGLARTGWWVLKDMVTGPGGPAGDDANRRRGGTMRGWREDLRFAWRSLAREPRFTALVVGVLSVGLALSLGVFAVVDAYLIEPLPFPEADRIVEVVDGGGIVSWDEVEDLFETAVSWDLDAFTLVGDGRPELVPGAWITPDFLETYGVQPVLGRAFLPEEADRYAAPVAMISHRLWQERFGGDPDVLGRSFGAFTSDRPDHAERFTIVGVLPADFWYLNRYTEVFAPIRGPRALYTGRLRTDVPTERAEQVMTTIALGKMAEVPEGFQVRLQPLQDRYVEPVRPTLYALQGAALLVFLIACANAAVLLLIRSTRRSSEIGIRKALGASSARLTRQLVLEGLVVAAVSGAAAAVLSVWGLEALKGGLEATIGRSVPGGLGRLGLDASEWIAMLGATAFVGVMFGLIPLAGMRVGLWGAGAERGGRGATESKGRRKARAGMIALEIALSLSLLIGSGLMVRSALNLHNLDLGFEPAGVVRGVVGLREESFPEPADRIAVWERLATETAALPGVDRVGLASSTPFTRTFNAESIEGLDEVGVTTVTEGISWTADEGYLATMDIALVRGRGFDAQDALGAEPVALVSESVARALWGEADPLGRRVRVPEFVMPGMPEPEPAPWVRVVGVVADVARDLHAASGDVYFPMRQEAPRWMNLVMRHHDAEQEVLRGAEQLLGGIASDAPMYNIAALDRAVSDAVAPTRTLATVLVAFAGFALLVTVLGLYGVIAYAVRQRLRDVAVRVALGADRRSVTGLFVRQGAVVVALGLALGVLGGVGVGRSLASQLHGVTPNDALTYVSLAALLGVTSLVAVWAPARGAARTDPMRVLRDE